MASKICPSCGAKNPSDAYSCTNCAASLIDSSSLSVGPVPSSPTNSSWPTITGTPKNPSSSSYSRYPEEEPRTSQSATSVSTGGQPLAVVKQSPLRNIMNALITVVFVVIVGFGVGFSSFGALISIAILSAIIAVPVILGFLYRPTFEFYDSFLQRTSRRGSQSIDYSEMRSVDKYRSSIRILLKGRESERFGPRALLIPADPKLSDGTVLSAWLKSKISMSNGSQTKDDNEASSQL